MLNFRFLWAANALRSAAGDLGTFALPITAALLLQASPLAMGAIAAAGNLSYAVLGLPAGVWIDRWNKRTVLIVADAVLAFSLTSIAIAYALDVLTVAQLIVVSAALGVAGMFFNIAHMSILPFILAKRAVADGNARLQTTNHAIGSVAPSLAGALAQAIAAPFLYGICAVLHVFSAAFLRHIDAQATMPVPASAAKRNFRSEIGDGLRTIWASPLLRLFLTQTSLNNLGAGMLMATASYHLLRVIGIDPWLFGALSSIGAVTGVVATLLCRRLRIRFGEVRMTMAFSWVAPLGVAMLPLAGMFRPLATVFTVAYSVILAFSLAGRSVSVAGIRARITPRSMLGRVSSANSTIAMGIIVLGSLLGGVVATEVSSTAALWLAFAVMMLPAVLIMRSPLRSVRTIPPEWEVAD